MRCYDQKKLKQTGLQTSKKLQGLSPKTTLPLLVACQRHCKSKCYCQYMSTLLHLVWLLLTVHHHTSFSYQKTSRTEDIRYIQIQRRFEPSLWPWPWKQQSNFFHKTLQLMMMYHPIKFGSKVGSSADMVETVIFDYMRAHCDHDLEGSKPIFLHDTGTWWCITIPSLVKKGSPGDEKSSRWTFTFKMMASPSLNNVKKKQKHLSSEIY